MAKPSPTSIALTLAKAGLSIGLLAFVLSKVDFAALWDRLDALVVPALIGAMLIKQLSALNAALRWRLILGLHDHGLALKAAWRNVLLGILFNQALPSTVGGDAVRIWHGTRMGLPLGLSARTLVVDRVMSFAGLLVFCVAGLPVLHRLTSDPAVTHGLVTLVIGASVVLCLLLALRFMPRILARVKGAEAAVALSRSAWMVLFTPRTMAPIAALLLIPHALDILVVWLYVLAIGSEATLWQLALVFPPAILVSAVPVSIAGWGLREGAVVLGFSVLGLPATEAVAVSLLFGVSEILTGALGGAIWAIGDPDGLRLARRKSPA